MPHWQTTASLAALGGIAGGIAHKTGVTKNINLAAPLNTTAFGAAIGLKPVKKSWFQSLSPFAAKTPSYMATATSALGKLPLGATMAGIAGVAGAGLIGHRIYDLTQSDPLGEKGWGQGKRMAQRNKALEIMLAPELYDEIESTYEQPTSLINGEENILA